MSSITRQKGARGERFDAASHSPSPLRSGSRMLGLLIFLDELREDGSSTRFRQYLYSPRPVALL